jgi:hypothetical protein
MKNCDSVFLLCEATALIYWMQHMYQILQTNLPNIDTFISFLFSEEITDYKRHYIEE